MTTIDYSQVASRYENNVIRKNVPRDPAIAGRPRLLDLGCGTGLYLAAQIGAHGADAAVWFGLDASAGMLGVARGKGLPVDLREGRAEALPYADDSFDYVVCRFAFHHFADKARALDEIARVVAPCGRVRFENFAPERSPDWWLFRYWPEAVAIDERRFWTVERMRSELERRGYAVEVTEAPMAPLPARLILAEAWNRETSELNLIDDTSYRAGLARLERDLGADPEREISPGLVIAHVSAARR